LSALSGKKGVENRIVLALHWAMTSPETTQSATVASSEQVQKEWNELTLRVKQLEAERTSQEQENKTLRTLLERVIEHRQKSHSELVLLLTALVSKLPMNDVGVIVSKLVEHNANVSEVCSVLIKGKSDAPLPQPMVLKALNQTKQELSALIKTTVEELIASNSPLDAEQLKGFAARPETFFAPPAVRATRGFFKGQVPRERIVKEFGEGAVGLFNDMTTGKLNPNPKLEEISLAFKSEFESLLPQSSLPADKQKELRALHEQVQKSKTPTPEARAQKVLFLKLSFLLEMIHYYESEGGEAPDVIFAQRLPAIVEQLVVSGPQDPLDEKLLGLAESLMGHVINPDYRHAIVNNIGKGGGTAATLRHVLRLRTDKVADPDYFVTEFVKHLLPSKTAPKPEALTPIVRLIKPDIQRLVVFSIMDSDRLRKEEAEALGKAIGKELALSGLDAPRKLGATITPELERQLAWEKIKGLITSRAEPGAIATAIRQRLHARYDADEMKQSWVTLTEADPISLIRVFCQLPYLADGSTDPVARAVMETYVTRLTHEKYATVYNKVMNSLRNMHKANPHSPTLLNFLALVKWVDPEAANKLNADIGMAVAA
jgi:hypothetical protein